jgi:hypothetical protein
LLSAANTADQGINFSTGKEQYLSCWFTTLRDTIAKEDLRLEVNGFGVASYWTGHREQWWEANFPLPRGLRAGWNQVRLRFADSDFGNALRIAVDLPLNVSRIVCQGVRDPATWKDSEIRAADSAYLACWVTGLPENADRTNVRVLLGDTRLSVPWLGEADAAGMRQINAAVPGSFPKGEHALPATKLWYAVAHAPAPCHRRDSPAAPRGLRPPSGPATRLPALICMGVGASRRS